MTKLGLTSGAVWTTGSFRVLLVMTGSAAPTTRAALTVQDIVNASGGLFEYNGSGYSMQTLSGMALIDDPSLNRTIADADDVAFGAIGGTPGTASIRGALTVKWGGTLNSSIPYFWKESGGLNGDVPAGGSRTITWPSTGLGIFRAP